MCNNWPINGRVVPPRAQSSFITAAHSVFFRPIATACCLDSAHAHPSIGPVTEVLCGVQPSLVPLSLVNERYGYAFLDNLRQA